MDTENKLLTLSELAAFLAVSVRTARRLVASGVILYYRLSRKALRFSAEEVSKALIKIRIPSRMELSK